LILRRDIVCAEFSDAVALRQCQVLYGRSHWE
jgi:hypothetical protein